MIKVKLYELDIPSGTTRIVTFSPNSAYIVSISRSYPYTNSNGDRIELSNLRDNFPNLLFKSIDYPDNLIDISNIIRHTKFKIVNDTNNDQKFEIDCDLRIHERNSNTLYYKNIDNNGGWILTKRLTKNYVETKGTWFPGNDKLQMGDNYAKNSLGDNVSNIDKDDKTSPYTFARSKVDVFMPEFNQILIATGAEIPGPNGGNIPQQYIIIDLNEDKNIEYTSKDYKNLRSLSNRNITFSHGCIPTGGGGRIHTSNTAESRGCLANILQHFPNNWRNDHRSYPRAARDISATYNPTVHNPRRHEFIELSSIGIYQSIITPDKHIICTNTNPNVPIIDTLINPVTNIFYADSFFTKRSIWYYFKLNNVRHDYYNRDDRRFYYSSSFSAITNNKEDVINKIETGKQRYSGSTDGHNNFDLNNEMYNKYITGYDIFKLVKLEDTKQHSGINVFIRYNPNI